MPHLKIITDTTTEMKNLLEQAITTNIVGGELKADGSKAKESLIRSSALINLLHEAVKRSLASEGLNIKNIYPPLGQSKPELKVAGFLKKKDQDVCVVPSNIPKKHNQITWGPLQFENEYDIYGQAFIDNTLIINVRSQMSSLAKNADTLFERTFAESTNLHTQYKSVVLGEVYLIPVFEYNETVMKNNEVKFKPKKTNLEKYISFFNALNNRKNVDDNIYKYEKCTLIIVDFSKDIPKIYNTTQELIDDNLISSEFNIELKELSYENFFKDILSTYKSRHDIKNLI
ncbi:MAG: hypothetical protein ACRC6T_04025 [Sarcina sp.]